MSSVSPCRIDTAIAASAGASPGLGSSSARSRSRLLRKARLSARSSRLSDPAWGVRRNAALALRVLGPAGELLLGRALRDDDRFARDIARQTLDLPEPILPA